MISVRHLTIAIATIGSVLVTRAAFAHAKLLTSSPSANEVVHVAPKEVSLHFSEELELSMSKVEVKSSTTGEVVSEGPLSQLSGNTASLKIALKPLKKVKAQYDVSWKAVAKDAHKMPGHISFTFEPKD